MFKLVLLIIVIVKVSCDEERNCLVRDINTGEPSWSRYHDSYNVCVTCFGSPYNQYSSNISQIFNTTHFPRCCSDGAMVMSGENCTNGDVIMDTSVRRQPCANESKCFTHDEDGECFSCKMPGHNLTQCLHHNKACNGVKDCENGEDEIGCPFYGGICPGFLCPSPHTKCLPESKVCDGRKDCVDGADEKNCSYCPQQFRCETWFDNSTMINTAECYNILRICDGVAHCKNGEDEENCHRWTEWTTWSDDQCINSTKRERTRECLDGSMTKVSSSLCKFGSDNSSTSSTQERQVKECFTPTTTTQQLVEPTQLVTTTKQETNNNTTTIISSDTSTIFEASSAVRTTSGEEEHTTFIGSNPTKAQDKQTTIALTTEPLNDFSSTINDSNDDGYLPAASFHGLSRNLQIMLLALSVFFAFLLLLFLVLYLIEKKRHSGKWSPTVRAASGQLPMPVRSYTNHGFESEQKRQQNKLKQDTTRSADSAFHEEAEVSSSANDKTNDETIKTEYSTSNLPLPPAEFLNKDYDTPTSPPSN